MSQTISVSTTMGEQGFRDFAVFDAFHHRKACLLYTSPSPRD